jgi:hypothetical protein
MSKLINISFICMIIFTFSFSLNLKSKPTQATLMKNIDYLFSGYDVFYGNPYPLSGKLDPGFRDQIFVASYKNENFSADDRFKVPDGTFLRQTMTCDMNMKHSEITGETSLKNTFSVEVGVDVSLAFVSFGANVDFKQISEDVFNKNTSWVESKADCLLYTGGIAQFAPPSLTENFLSGLSSIANKDYASNKESFFGFFSVFGTHFLNRVSMGARFGARSKISTENLVKIRSHNSKVGAHLGIGDLFKMKSNVGSGSTNTQKDDSLFKEISVFSIGSSIPADLKIESWISKTVEEPMPISYSVIPIFELLKRRRAIVKFPVDLKDENQQTVNIQKLAVELEKATRNYCKDYLLPNREVRSCDKHQADIDIVIKKNERLVMDKLYSIQNVKTGKCLFLPNKIYGHLWISTCDPSKRDFKFTSIDARPGLMFVMGKDNSNFYVTNHHGHNIWAKFQLDKNFHHSSIVVENSDFSYTIKHPNGQCWQPINGNSFDGTNPVLVDCNGSDEQKWRLISS